MTIDQETKCDHGPSALFPEVEQCPAKPIEYIFGQPFCKTHADAMRNIHLQGIRHQERHNRGEL